MRSERDGGAGPAAPSGGESGRADARLRILVFAAFVGIGLVRLAVRAAELQVGYGPTLQAMADEQHQREFQPPIRRGPIVDRNGAELALTVDVDSIYANPPAIADPASTAAALARTLGIDPRTIEPRLRGDRRFAWVKRHVTPAQAAAVAALRLPGIAAAKEPRRFYPGRELAAQLVGFAGFDSTGLDGLEHRYDALLRGDAAHVRGIRDARGRMIFLDGLPQTRIADGRKVVLSIDRTIQFIAEHELAAGLRTFEGIAGSAVVMDPRTGEVLALANAPSYDPNLYSAADPEARRNRALADRFEPGSTMKVFAVAALLDAGLMDPEEQVYCEGGVHSIGDYVIRDADRNEWLTITQCLARSSNVCVVKLAAVLGKRRLHDAYRRFGFGERTGVPAPAETSGLLRHPDHIFDVDLASMSFGQGMSVSNLQMAAAISAIANGGTLMRPLLVRAVIDSDGRIVREFPITERRRAVDARTARLMTDMLTAVTEPGGTGIEAAVPGFAVAGKTGTAQKADPVRGGYHQDRWIASFIGFIPADDPRIVVSVVVDEPLVSHYGGTVAGPIFRRIADRTLRYLGVAPGRLPGRAAARGPAAHDAPAPEPLTVTGVPLALPRPGEVEAPDFSGETIRSALRVARDAGLEIDVLGSGLAVEQWPDPGTGVAPGGVVRVRFSTGQGLSP